MASRLLVRGFRLKSMLGAHSPAESLSSSLGILKRLNQDTKTQDPSFIQRRHGRGDRRATRVISHREMIDRFRQQQLENEQKEKLMGTGEAQVDEDMPDFSITNPYAKPQRKCIICEHNVPLDYKNVRLLSQFISPYSGRIYGRHITGLCDYMHTRVTYMIHTARAFGYLPGFMKEPKYLKDPKLFDPFKRALYTHV